MSNIFDGITRFFQSMAESITVLLLVTVPTAFMQPKAQIPFIESMSNIDIPTGVTVASKSMSYIQGRHVRVVYQFSDDAFEHLLVSVRKNQKYGWQVDEDTFQFTSRSGRSKNVVTHIRINTTENKLEYEEDMQE